MSYSIRFHFVHYLVAKFNFLIFIGILVYKYQFYILLFMNYYFKIRLKITTEREKGMNVWCAR